MNLHSLLVCLAKDHDQSYFYLYPEYLSPPLLKVPQGDRAEGWKEEGEKDRAEIEQESGRGLGFNP